MIIFHDPHCAEYSAPGYPERPERITRTVPLLKDQHRNWEWREPRAATDEELLRAHSREHLARIAAATDDFDSDTPAYPKIDTYARQSAWGAVEATPRSRLGSHTHHF